MRCCWKIDPLGLDLSFWQKMYFDVTAVLVLQFRNWNIRFESIVGKIFVILLLRQTECHLEVQGLRFFRNGEAADDAATASGPVSI